MRARVHQVKSLCWAEKQASGTHQQYHTLAYPTPKTEKARFDSGKEVTAACSLVVGLVGKGRRDNKNSGGLLRSTVDITQADYSVTEISHITKSVDPIDVTSTYRVMLQVMWRHCRTLGP